MQVGHLRQQIGLSQRDTGSRLLEVDTLADATAGALGDLVIHLAVVDVVVLRKPHQLLVAHGVQVRLCSLKSNLLRRTLQFVILIELGEAEGTHVLAGSEAIKKHLRDGKPGSVTRVATQIHQRRLAFLAADFRAQVHTGKVTALRRALRLTGGLEVVPRGTDPWVGEHRLRDGFPEIGYRLRLCQRCRGVQQATCQNGD